MTERDERIRRILAEILEVPLKERSSFLDEACGGDASMRAEVTGVVEERFSRSAAAAPHLPAGKDLAGRFRVVRFVGGGGMGDVYEVEDLQLREHVALKTIRPEAVGEAMLTRFKREIQYAKRVTHPNVCRIYDFGLHQEGEAEILFLTMELLHGETLAARLRTKSRMTTAQALPLVVQMAEGLAAAHEAGIIHRDFKTSNVILTGSDSRPKAVVTDFGLARPAAGSDDASLTESGKIVGTPSYMAPEQLTQGELTPATDIYALGLVMYEMVTGRRPFSGDTPIAAAMKRLTQPPQPPSGHVPGLDPCWETAIMRCLERESERRFQNPREVVQALTTIYSPTRTLTTGWTKGLRAARSRTAIAAVAGIALLGAGLAGVWTLGRHRPPAAAVRWYEEGTRALRDGTSFTAMNAFERAVALDPGFSLAHGRLAEAATELDYMDKAKTEMLRATPPTFQSFFLSTEDRLRLDAVYFVLVKDFDKAATKYKELAGEVPSSERAAVLVDLGRAYEGGSKVKEALASYTESIERDSQYAAAFLRRAVLEGRQQMNAKANADFDVAEQLYHTQGRSEGIIEVLYQRAALLRRIGRLAEARAPSQTALEMARASGDEYHHIRALLALSQISYSSGDTDGGQQYAQQAIDLARRAGIDVLAASGLVDIGNALFRKGDNAAAEPYLRSAIESAKRIQALRVEGRAEVTLGQILVRQGHASEALSTFALAVGNLQQAGDSGNAKIAATTGARVLRGQGQYEAAASLLRQQLEHAEQVKEELGIALAAQALGSVLLIQERYPDALAALDKSVAASHSIADLSDEAYSEVSRAEALWRLGRYREAEERLAGADALDQRLNGNKPLMASISGARGGLELSRQRFKEAEEIARQMVDAEKGVPPSASARRILGLALIRQGRVKEGRALCEEAAHLDQGAASVAAMKNSELALAEARLASGDKPGALAIAVGLAEFFAGRRQAESELHALAVAVSASQGAESDQYRERVKTVLEKLRQDLGEAFSGFASRPDIHKIIRALGLLSGGK